MAEGTRYAPGVVLVLTLSLLAGYAFGHVMAGVAVGLAYALSVNLRKLRRLHHWLGDPGRRELPDTGGLWGDVFDRLHRLLKATRARESALRDQAERFQDAGRATPDAMLILSDDGDIEWANPATERLFGIHRGRDTGQRLINLVRHPALVDYLTRGAYAEPLEMPSPTRVDLTLSVQIVPFGQRQKFVIARDVTRIQALENMRRTFVSNISHELRTPLTVVAGYLEHLEDETGLDPAARRQAIAAMHTETQRMRRLVEDLLSLSRLETGPPPRTDIVRVSELLKGVAEQARAVSGTQNHVVTVAADSNLGLRGDAEELQSAFGNLAINAVRYSPPDSMINLTWSRQSDQAVLSVHDAGDGIPPEHLSRLTERFYRVDTGRSRASGGTGLGLSIVKHVLLRHEAQLDIESQPGKGSVFSSRFPAARIVDLTPPPSTVAPSSP